MVNADFVIVIITSSSLYHKSFCLDLDNSHCDKKGTNQYIAMNQTGTGTVRNNEKLNIDIKNKVIQLTGGRYQRDISFKISRSYIRFYDQFQSVLRDWSRRWIKSVFEGTYKARPTPTLVSFGPLEWNKLLWRASPTFSYGILLPPPPGDTMPTIVQVILKKMIGMAGILEFRVRLLSWIERAKYMMRQ